MEYLLYVLAPVLLLLLLVAAILLIARRGKGNEYDERQLVERGRAFQSAYLTLGIYTIFCAVIESDGVQCFTPGVLPMIGLFLSVTVFAVTAIRHDALSGLHTKPKDAIRLWLLIIVVQLVCFVLDWRDGDVVRDGVLTLSVISLVNAVCFLVMLVVYLAHSRKAALPEEEP